MLDYILSNFTFYEPCIVMHLCKKDQRDYEEKSVHLIGLPYKCTFYNLIYL
jgi:hypothetical protein